MKCLAWRLAHVGRSKNVSYCYFYWQTLFLLFPAIRFSPPFLSVAVLMHTPPPPAPGGSLCPFIARSLLWWGCPRWLSGKETACNAEDAGDMGSAPGLGRCPGEGMATHSSILAWEIPWTGKPGWLQVLGVAKTEHACAFLWWSPLWAGSHTVALPGSRVEA